MMIELEDFDMSKHWHYQLMKQNFSGEDYYGIHEYYPDLEGGDAWTEEPVAVTGESIEDVKWALEQMLKDVDKHGVKKIL